MKRREFLIANYAKTMNHFGRSNRGLPKAFAQGYDSRQDEINILLEGLMAIKCSTESNTETELAIGYLELYERLLEPKPKEKND